jgi:hypothetical protein
VKKVIRTINEPAASEAQPMASSRGGVSPASAARGSDIEDMSLARPGGGGAYAIIHLFWLVVALFS